MKDFKSVYGSSVVGDWPTTKAKNASGPSAVDGTPYDEVFINGIWGFQKALMHAAGLTPNGVQEDYNASQLLEALERKIRGPGEVAISAMNAATLATRRLLPLAAQVVPIASYQAMCDAVYVGDTENATAVGFYKTSDSGGVTRSTSGAYMVLPDARGLVVRGIGENVKVFKANGQPYTGGSKMAEMLLDAIQGFSIVSHAAYSSLNNGTGELAGGGGTPGAARSHSIASSGSDGTPRFSNETRGASICFQFCITY